MNKQRQKTGMRTVKAYYTICKIGKIEKDTFRNKLNRFTLFFNFQAKQFATAGPVLLRHFGFSTGGIL
jgi:hypothetical protein